MRSFTLVVLFALALAIVSFAPVASADANVTLYADMFCSQMMGDGPQTIPIPSSYSCQDMSGPSQSGSGIFYCLNSAGYNNFSLSAWMTTSDCSGEPDVTITSYGKVDTCVNMAITAGGQSIPAFAKVSCSSSSEVSTEVVESGHKKAFQFADVAHTLSVAKRAAFTHNAGKAGRHAMFSRLAHPNRVHQNA